MLPIRIRIRTWIRLIRLFLGLLFPDQLVRGKDPDPDPLVRVMERWIWILNKMSWIRNTAQKYSTVLPIATIVWLPPAYIYLYYMATKGCLGQGFLVPYTFAPFMVRSLFSEQLLSLFGTTVSGSGFRTSVLFIRIIVPKCCGSWMFIPDSKYFHPRIRIFSILDPHPLPSKKFSILTQSNGLKALGNMIRVFHPGSGSWLSTHPWSSSQKATGSRIWIRSTDKPIRIPVLHGHICVLSTNV